MTNKEILEKAIQKAIDGGWNFQPFPEQYFPISYMNGDVLVKHIATTIDDLRLFATIFNHDFAKALWGEEPYERESDNYLVRDGRKNWVVHLQQMVISEDSIKYLGENI